MSSRFKYKHFLCSWVFIALITSLVGCVNSQKTIVPEVTVIKVEPTTIDISQTLSGRLESIRQADVRARTPGVIKKIYFEEGTYIKQGSPLFLIDDTPTRAQVAVAQAKYTQASNYFNKISPLTKSGAISQTEYDNALTKMQEAKATLESMQINLDHVHIKAPISGKIGKAYQTEGALVGQGQPTLLAMIQQESPLTIDIHQSVNDYMKLKNYVQKSQTSIENLPFDIILNNGSIHTEQGRILFADSSVDETTGQITIKGEIPNQDGLLLPGLFVKIKIKIGSMSNIFAIPIKAVNPNELGGKIVIVKQDGTYAERQINIVHEDADYIYTNHGLEKGELIVVDGHIKLMMRPPKVGYKITSE